MAKLMVSVSGVRGIVGDGLTPEIALRFAQAFGAFSGKGKVVVGRDSRVTGAMLKDAITAGLLSVGCDILDIGVCPTPTTQMAVENLKAVGGIMITASHNPIMWNGMKLIGHAGLFLDATEGEQVVRISQEKMFPFSSWDRIGVKLEYSKAIAEHLAAILDLDFVNPEQIRDRKLKVVLDCVCGAGSVMVPKLLSRLGCDVVPINCEPTGLFPRNPEPLPEHLTEVCEKVIAEQADLGIVVDPDSDRLALISEKGEPLGEERTLALATHFILGRKKGPIVVNASTSRVHDDIAESNGVEVIRTQVGEIHVAKRMREVGAVIGGEGNGGVILPDIHLGRDAPAGVALTLQHLAEFSGTISELNDTLPNYVIIKTKVELENIEPSQALDKIRSEYANETLDLTDGVKLLRGKSWVHIRPSNTEPIIRVIAEAPTAAEAEQLAQEIMEHIK